MSCRQGRPGAGTPAAAPGGEPVVMLLTVTAVAFLVATALVIALARGSTARWERENRAASASMPASMASRDAQIRARRV